MESGDKFLILWRGIFPPLIRNVPSELNFHDERISFGVLYLRKKMFVDLHIESVYLYRLIVYRDTYVVKGNDTI